MRKWGVFSVLYNMPVQLRTRDEGVPIVVTQPERLAPGRDKNKNATG